MQSPSPFRKRAAIRELKELYSYRKGQTIRKLAEFRRRWETADEGDIFAELVFCILTPQAKARACWATVENLLNKNLMFKGGKTRLARELHGSRFKYKKAEYILEARKQFSSNRKVSIRSKIEQFSDPYRLREWLVHNVRGIGYKEASHFLRNIGFGEEVAILDRHILRNLKSLGIIERVPTHLAKNRYVEIENKMKKFAEKVNIPVSHLDLIFWYNETRDIFK